MEKKVIFKCIVGSTAYGTNVVGSDIDIKGVYAQEHKDILTFNYEQQIEVNKDEVYYEVRRFIELLMTANPTVIEMLFMPEDCILEKSPEFDILLKNKHLFLTKACRNSFGGYAVQQIRKARGLNKKMNWEKSEMQRKTPIDFCYVYFNGMSIPLTKYLEQARMKQEYCGLVAVDHMRDGYALYYDFNGADGAEPIGLKGIQLEDSNSIRLSSVPKGMFSTTFVHYNKDGYTQHCNKYKEYTTWLKERNTQRYVDLEEHGQQIDGKNMLHCRRLLDMAMEIAQTGTLTVRRPNAEELVNIRKGKVKLEDILDQAEADVIKLDELYANCNLPDSVSLEVCNQILEEIRYLKQ